MNLTLKQTEVFLKVINGKAIYWHGPHSACTKDKCFRPKKAYIDIGCIAITDNTYSYDVHAGFAFNSLGGHWKFVSDDICPKCGEVTMFKIGGGSVSCPTCNMPFHDETGFDYSLLTVSDYNFYARSDERLATSSEKSGSRCTCEFINNGCKCGAFEKEMKEKYGKNWEKPFWR